MERDVVEGDGSAAPDQRFGLGMILQFVRQQQRRNRFRHPRYMLGDVDQRYRKIAGRAQDRKPQRTDQHDVAGGCRARCQSVITQANSAIVSTTVTTAWVSRSFSR